MKKISKIFWTLILSTASLTSTAQDFYSGYYRHRSFIHYPNYYEGFGLGHIDRHHHYRYKNLNFLAPAVVGGIIGYSLAKPGFVTNRPVNIAPKVIYSYPVEIYRSSQPLVYSSPVGYRYESILDTSCNCYSTVLVPN